MPTLRSYTRSCDLSNLYFGLLLLGRVVGIFPDMSSQVLIDLFICFTHSYVALFDFKRAVTLTKIILWACKMEYFTPVWLARINLNKV